METYAVVAAKAGRCVPPRVVAALDEPQMSSLLFTAESHAFWSDNAGRVCVGAWQRGADALGIGCRWEIRPSGLTTFTGHLWQRGAAWVNGRSWASQLADRFEHVPLNASLEDFQGVYTVVSIDANGDGAIACDPFAFGQLFVGETEDILVVSSRAAVVKQLCEVAGQPSARDAEAVASMVYASFVLGSRTGYQGIKMLAPGEYFALSATGAALRSWTRAPWLPAGNACGSNLRETVNRVRAELAGSVRAVAAVDAPRRIANLTGGRDSRLVLALLVAEGLTDRFEFNTHGAADLPDTIVATLIAEHFNLRHSVDVDAKRSAVTAEPTDTSFDDHLRHHVWATSAMGNPWDLRPPVRTRSDRMIVTGTFGETYRTRYVRAARLTNTEQLIAYVHARASASNARSCSPMTLVCISKNT